MNFVVYTPPCVRKFCILVSYQMLNFRPHFNLNLFSGGCMPALPMYKYDLEIVRPLAKENSTIDELKIPNIRPFFFYTKCI